MSDMHARFVDSADRRAGRALLGLSGTRRRSGVAGSSPPSPGTKADGRLRALLEQKITEADHLEGFLCSLDLPILHLSPDLRLRRFSQAAAQLFGLGSADLGGWLNSRWPTAPMRVVADVCKTGVPCKRIAQGPDGRDWQCQILPHSAPHGATASVMVILLAQPDAEPVDPSASDEKTDLTPRQRQIMELVLAGHPNKNIAAHLKISQRTVENHRAAIMMRTGATSLPALARIAVGAAGHADHRLHHSLRALPDLRA